MADDTHSTDDAAKTGGNPMHDAAQRASDTMRGASEAMRGAFTDHVMDPARRAGEAMRASGQKVADGSAALGLKIIEQAERNSHDAFEAMREAAQARDVPVGSVGIFTDLREKMRMEQSLKQAQEQLIEQERQAVIAELAGAAAHELNQPLTSVLNYATLLRRLLTEGSQGERAAAVIEQETERMAEIVRKIGKITKYETKSYVGKQKILDLDKASEESTKAEKPAPEPNT